MSGAEDEFARIGPWLTRFWVEGVPCGGDSYDPTDDARMKMFEAKANPLKGKRVLELGPLEGGHTLQLARKGAAVVGIEGHETNVERCLFVKEFFHLEDVDFIVGDLRTFNFRPLGQFDFIFNVGVLYHLDEPWKLLASLRGAAQRMFISTHCAPPDKVDAEVVADGHSLRGMWWIEGPLEAALSGLQPKSFWPTRDCLEEMLAISGWPRLSWMDYNPDFQNGPLAALWVEQSE